MMSKGPKNFSASLVEGWVVLKDLALTKACCPTLKSGVSMHWRSAGPWYQSWDWAIVDFSSWWSLSRLMASVTISLTPFSFPFIWYMYQIPMHPFSFSLVLSDTVFMLPPLSPWYSFYSYAAFSPDTCFIIYAASSAIYINYPSSRVDFSLLFVLYLILGNTLFLSSSLSTC